MNYIYFNDKIIVTDKHVSDYNSIAEYLLVNLRL